MSEMVERVAFAMAHVREPTDYEMVARAAIAAMREPTQAMIEKGFIARSSTTDVWQAMIDEALRDE